MCESLVELRDQSFPGKQIWNTEEGFWGLQTKTYNTGAIFAPRLYLSQLVTGIDKIYWFMGQHADDPTCLINAQEEPYPTYVSYAVMTRLLDRATVVGRVDLGAGNWGVLFARGADMVLAAWRVLGEAAVTVPAGVNKASVVDIMGRRREVAAPNGTLNLTFTESVQYVELPRNDYTLGIARKRVDELLTLGGAPDVKAIADEIPKIAAKAAADNAEMTRLYYLVRAAEMAVIAGQAPPKKAKPTKLAAAARQAIVSRERDDGYLRQARVALEWVDRLATRPAGAGNAWAVQQAAAAVKGITAHEKPCYPGVVINAFIGEPGEVARIRAIVPKKNDYSTTIDEKFRFQIDRKAGETFDLELTVWNYYRHKISGRLAPRLPEGWSAATGPVDFAIEPGKFHRVVFHVTVGAATKAGLYTVGGQCTYHKQPVTEIRPQRIHIQ